MVMVDLLLALRPSPREPHSAVSNWVALHLGNCHFCGLSLHVLHKTTALSGWDLDVGDVSKALEVLSQLVFGHGRRQAAHKHSCIVGVCELVERMCGPTVEGLVDLM